MTTGVQGSQPAGNTVRTVTLYGGIAASAGGLVAGGIGAWNYIDGKHVTSAEDMLALRTSSEQAQQRLDDVLRSPSALPNDDAVRAAAEARFGNDRVIATAVGNTGHEQPIAVQAFGHDVASDAASAIAHAPTGHPELGRVALHVGDGQFLGAVVNDGLEPYPALRTESKLVTVSDGSSIHSDTISYHRATTGQFDQFKPLLKGVDELHVRTGSLTNLGTDEENTARETAERTKAAWRHAVDDAAAAPHQLAVGTNMFVLAGALAAVGVGILAVRQMGAFDNA